MALDTMAFALGWPTVTLADLFVDFDPNDEPSARLVTRVATSYVALVRKLAAEKTVTASDWVTDRLPRTD